MTPGRPGAVTAPNLAYAGQVVHFPDPVRHAQFPDGVRIDDRGFPNFSPYARAAAEIDDPPQGFGVDELRLTDYVSANAVLAASGHKLWEGLDCPVATPIGWTWHHVPGSRRLELVPTPVKALLRHHGGVATSAADQGKRGTRPLQDPRPAHLRLPEGPQPVSEQQVRSLEESLGYQLPGPYRAFLKVAGGCTPVGTALDPAHGILVDQPFLTLRGQHSLDDLHYVNKCLREFLTKDYLGIAYVQGGLLALKVKGEGAGSVWFSPWDDARDYDGYPVEQRVRELLLPCGDDFDDFLTRLAGRPPELETVAKLMVDGGFARAVPVEVR
ncbi:cell wall assembly protein Knr4 [Mangrovactinospora gilvigrisea]|uniref:Cell wall assembly protein Knr4 n=1 Tax=Mangrovactinospora gilvigrisea TaxID=1428644 RepID=A0A1J7BJK2_9ACTN|nr:SMI1/KNR4 family protein [Mangrovactinospora gilvigrisea]OIV38859.1 cell wall assembly protein Knr4 [Mangrovactinospora gilvigrisea]